VVVEALCQSASVFRRMRVSTHTTRFFRLAASRASFLCVHSFPPPGLFLGCLYQLVGSFRTVERLGTTFSRPPEALNEHSPAPFVVKSCASKRLHTSEARQLGAAESPSPLPPKTPDFSHRPKLLSPPLSTPSLLFKENASRDPQPRPNHKARGTDPLGSSSHYFPVSFLSRS